MNKLIQEFLKGGKITVSPWQVTAEGGAAILAAFILVLIAVLL